MGDEVKVIRGGLLWGLGMEYDRIEMVIRLIISKLFIIVFIEHFVVVFLLED